MQKVLEKEEEEVQIQVQTEWDMRACWRRWQPNLWGFIYCVRDVQDVSLFKVQLVWLQNKKIGQMLLQVDQLLRKFNALAAFWPQCLYFTWFLLPHTFPFFLHQLQQSWVLHFNVSMFWHIIADGGHQEGLLVKFGRWEIFIHICI